MIAGEWEESDNKRKAKFYSLTAAGRQQLQSETKKWDRMTSLIARILQTTREELRDFLHALRREAVFAARRFLIGRGESASGLRLPL